MMSEDLRGVWGVAVPGAAVAIWLGRGNGTRRQARARIRDVDPGAAIVIVRPAFCGARGARKALSDGGRAVGKPLVLLPSAREPLLVIGGREESLTHATAALLAAPPRVARLGWAWAAACRLLTLRAGRWLLRVAAPRAVVGRPS